MANFNSVPQMHFRRTKFPMPYSRKQSQNVGGLYPFMVQEIYPGDTFKGKCNMVARLTTQFLKPVMDNLFMDVYFFFVPSRLCFDKWSEIFGENKRSAWKQVTPVSAPVTSSGQTVYSRSVADYLGLPLGSVPKGINILPFRAFALIYDEWFRDQNNMPPMHIYKGAFDGSEGFNNLVWASNNYTGYIPEVAKFHDYFTSCLPDPQKGNAVGIPVGTWAPVVPRGNNTTAVMTGTYDNNDRITLDVPDRYAEPFINLMGINYGTTGRFEMIAGDLQSYTGIEPAIKQTNLWADLSGAGGVTINTLRDAFALQKVLEKAARSGTRYTEYLLSTFGVQSPDGRLQRPEYISGKRFPLSVQQVAQTTPGANSDELGQLGAFSLSNGDCAFEKGFVEHGFLIGVSCIRQYHTYQQGVERFWHRHNRFDYYDPVFARLGEQPVYRSEIYADGETTLDEHVFGYNEAYADLRYRPASLAGDMKSDSTRPGAGGTQVSSTLDLWHFADDFASYPVLGSNFIVERPYNVDRTIAVHAAKIDQFMIDYFVDQEAIRVLPRDSIPAGL